MSNAVLIISAVAFLAICLIWSFFRGLAKSRIRGICVIVSALGAFGATALCKQTLVSEHFINENVLPWLESAGLEEVSEFLGISPTLNEVLLKCISSLISPILCLAFFLVFCLVTWVIFLILTLIFSDTLREQNARSFLAWPRALAWGLIQAVIVLTIFMLPVASYLEIVPGVMNAVLETEVLEEQDAELVSDILEEQIKPLDEGGAVKAYRTLGGRALGCLLTDFEINESKTHLADEVDSVTAFACNVYRLTKTEFTDYSSDEAVVFVAVADSFEDSVLLPTIAGEIIYGATDAWLDGKTFLGVERPSFGEMNDVFDPFFEALLKVLHTDSRNSEALQGDIRTVADMIATLANQEVFSKSSDTQALMKALSSNGIISDLVTSLGANESMKILIPEITNLGVRAVATTLEIPGDTEAVYETFLEDVTVALNDARRYSGEKQIENLSEDLRTAFDEAGLAIDGEIIDCYAVSMTKDLVEKNSDRELTSDDVRAFFAVYAMNADTTELSAEDPTTVIAQTGTPTSETLLVGTVYENMTAEELQNSGAVALAKACKLLSAMAESQDQSISEQAAAVLSEVYAALLEADSVAMDRLMKIDLEEPISEDTLRITVGLRAMDEMITTRVIWEDLLVDTEKAAQKINSETLAWEAAAIEKIIEAASKLSDEMMDGGDFDLNEVAGPVGTILDSLHLCISFGADMTADLFTAVLQSELVRTSADMDVATATKMAVQATEGELDYTATMVAVARGVTVFTKLGENGKSATEEELEELVRNMTPQTAGMIETYVTAERIEGYGVSSKYSATSEELISSTFSYMANEELEDYNKEAQALDQVLSITISATSHSSGRQLFSDENHTGILPSATETVNTFMESVSVSNSLRSTMLNEDGELAEEKFDAFDLSEKMPADSAERAEFVEAVEAYYAEHPSEENKQTLTALSALFGVEMDWN